MTQPDGSAAEPPEISAKETELEQSRDLVRIVSVVYGVALTQAVVLNRQVVLHPVASTHSATALAIFAAVWFATYGYFSYVLALGSRTYSYRIYWSGTSTTDRSNQGRRRRDTIRFCVDLLLAGAYAWLLVAAADVTPTGAHNHNPPSLLKVVTYLCGFALVLAIASVVRLLRYAHGDGNQADKTAKQESRSKQRERKQALVALIRVPGVGLLLTGAGIWIVYWQSPMSMGSVRWVVGVAFGLTIAYSIVSVIDSHKRRLAQSKT